MDKEILNHYLQTGIYTNFGAYESYYKSLPDDIHKLRDLVNKQHIHKMDLYRAFKGENDDITLLSYDWQNYRCLDDVLLTAPAMTAELFRITDGKGFLQDNNDPNKKLVITCRYVSVLFASILKAKGIPCRCRSGFAPYLYDDKIVDHWIVQYYNKDTKKWANVEVQANVNIKDFDIMDFDNSHFTWAANAWLAMRNNTLPNKEKYVNGTKHFKDMTFAWSLMMDFHSLFNDEINYITTPVFLYECFDNLSLVNESTLKEMDKLATLMLDVDANFNELKHIWQTNKTFRSVSSSLNAPFLHLELD